MNLLNFITAIALFVFSSQTYSSVKFRFPIANEDRTLISGLPIIGMDHDELHGKDKKICENYRGAKAPFCYNDHEGTDYILIGGFATMDKGSAEVVAAADGIVTDAKDGNYDRCAVDFRTFNTSCHGHAKKANLVSIVHKDGTTTRYLHLKKGSVKVKVGDKVKCGQALGLVGSSGNSSMPHLHFDVRNKNGKYVDPYKGKNSQNFSYWHKEFEHDGLPSGTCQSRSSDNVVARCGWETIQDASSCGTELIVDALACGTKTVSDAVACGQELVNCGSKTVTDAAQCGTKIVTDAVKCGTNFVTNIAQCLSQGLNIFNGGCSLPKSCSVAKTCTISLQCFQAKSCQVANSCEVAKSCQINSCRNTIRQFSDLRFEISR